MTRESLDQGSAQVVVSALADPDSRAILGATAAVPRSAPELIKRCDIPTATAYRKINSLSDIGLLDDRIRINPDGRNVTEYKLRAETIVVEIPPLYDVTATYSIDTDTRIQDEEVSGDEATIQLQMAMDGGEESAAGVSEDQQT